MPWIPTGLAGVRSGDLLEDVDLAAGRLNALLLSLGQLLDVAIEGVLGGWISAYHPSEGGIERRTKTIATLGAMMM